MILNIETKKIAPHPNNPRKDLGDLSELASGIAAKGILQNLTVVPLSETQDIVLDEYPLAEYVVVIGHRRLEAAKTAGITEVPCSVSDMSFEDQIEVMLLENIQRSDLTVWEQAQGFQLMLDLGATVNGEKYRRENRLFRNAGRRFIGIDLNPDYCAIAENRITIYCFTKEGGSF